MKIIKVTSADVKRFVDFPDKLYHGDPNYVPYMRADLRRTLKKLLFDEATYTALLAENERGEVVGRVLFTIDRDKQLQTERCGFFSMYECIDDREVSRALLGEMRRILQEQGAEYISGTYFPYDQDNRRGIMVKGFERPPLIFTSYNPPYYEAQMLDAGFAKLIDTYEFAITPDEAAMRRFKKLSDYAMRRYDFHVDTADFQNIDRDIDDVCAVMQAATNEINYQEAPRREVLARMLTEWKRFIDPDFILIARSNADNTPLGFGVALPDYFHVFRKMRGRLDLVSLVVLAIERNNIHSLRNILQYVVPEWQGKGILPAIYIRMYYAAKKHEMDYIEAGTVIENNQASIAPLEASGGKIARIYRIYYQKLEG